MRAAKITVSMLQTDAILEPPNLGGLAVYTVTEDWRADMVRKAGVWFNLSRQADEAFDRDRLVECCNESIRVVGGISIVPRRVKPSLTIEGHLRRNEEHRI